ncbi:MAG: hypothetical protein V1484_02000 [bacterium]
MELSEITKKYWTEKDFQDLEKAESVKDLFAVAEKIIERMPKPFVQVCGPINTGGLGSTEANLKVFNDTIIQLQNKELNVFDQMPFEDSMLVLNKRLTKNGGYFDSILTDFYYPIFESGLVSAFYFMPNLANIFRSKLRT